MKRKVFCSVSALAVTALTALWATPGKAATAAATAEATSPTSVSELIVTAQRREQNIETVPVAVTALSAQMRSLIGIQTLQDVTDFTPGLSYTAIDDRPYIRGIGRNTDNLSTASAIATYYNGVYYGANAAIIMQKDDLFISNIEIDRGPQNTLHGSNSDGGTINYVSQKPTSTFYAEGRASAANYGEYMGEAVVSGPLSDHVRIRLGAMYTDDSGGYFKNLDGPAQGGNISLGSSGTEQYLEAQVAADFGHLDIWAMASSGNSWANYHNQENIGNIPDNLFINGQFEPSGFYGLCGLPGVAASANGAGCNVVGAPTIVSVTTDPVTANMFPGNNPGNVNQRDFIQEFTSSNNQRNDIAFATTWTYHFPSFDLTYIGGFQEFDYELNFTTGADSGVTSYQLAGPTAANAGTCAFLFPANAAACTQPLTINPTPNLTYFAERDWFFSHEIDLTSTGNSPLQYLAGLYWYHEHYNQPVDAGVEPDQSQMANPFYVSGLGGGPVCSGGAIFCPAPANPQAAFSTSDTQLKYDDLAAFADVSYKVNSQFKINGAVRYTYDHKRGDQFWRFEEFDDAALGVPDSTGFGAATPAVDLTAALMNTATCATAPATCGPGQVAYAGTNIATLNAATGNWERSLDATWRAVTGEADIDWTPDSTTLAYFRYARGYKSGGFSTFTIGASPETFPEYVDSFEIGGKKTIGSVFSLNAAAFYYNYSNDQVPLTVEQGGLLVPIIFNLPLVHTYGVEMEGVWRPVDHLTLSLNYAFLSAKIANDGGCLENVNDPLALLPGSNTSGCVQNGGPGVVLQHIDGESLPEAPRNKIAFNALYAINFEPGSLTLSGSVIWKDVTYDDVFNRFYSKQPPYTLVNLRATWTDAKDRYNVILFCNNVFNELGYDGATGTLLAAEQAGQTPDIISQYGLTAPRTYGVEFEYRFR